jgi:capsular polysaccharide biosynthesis protein
MRWIPNARGLWRRLAAYRRNHANPSSSAGHSATPATSPTNKSVLPLTDVHSYAVQNGRLIAAEIQIDAAISVTNASSMQEHDWKSSRSYPRPYVAQLEDIVVLPGSSVLLCSAGQALSDEIALSFREFSLPPKLVNMEISKGPCLRMDADTEMGSLPNGIHLFKEHEANYFHWTVETLPRLFMCEKLMLDDHLPVLVSQGLHENLYALLDLVRHPGRPVLKLRKSSRYRVQSLIYPSDLSRILDVYDRPPDTDTTYIPVDLLREMAISIKQTGMPQATRGKKRLFLRRGSTYRKLLNEAEIEQILAKRDFLTVDLNGMSVKEQISLFSQAEIVVGPSGAGMTNILWCEPSTRVLILHSDHPSKKYPYWDALGRVSGARIHYLAGPRAFNVTDRYEVHDDYRIDPGRLTDCLADLLD